MPRFAPALLPSLAFLFFSGCAPQPETGGAIVFAAPDAPAELEVAYALDESAAILGGVAGVSFDAAGSLLVPDYQQQKVFEFNSDQKLVRAYGGPGEGPGEFVTVVGAVATPDSLYAFDGRINRLSVFSRADGSFIRSIGMKLDDWSPFTLLGVHDDEVFALYNPAVSFADASFAGENYELRAVSLTGELLRPLWQTPRIAFHPIEVSGTRMLRIMPLSPDSHCAVTARAGYCAYSTELRVSMFSLDGESLNEYYVEAPPRPVTAAERDEVLAGFENPELRRQIVVPDRHPAFTGGIVVDERERIWLRRSASPDQGTVFWVIDPYLAAVSAATAEGSVIVHDAREGKLAATVRRPDGSQSVVVFFAPTGDG